MAKPKVRRKLRKGNRGKAVKRLQRSLNKSLPRKTKVDGIFGSQTKRRVKNFQKKNGLTADGVVGPATWRKAGYKYVAPPSKVTKSSNTRWPTNKKLMAGLKGVSKDTGKTVHIVSGYRSYAQQAYLYNGWIRRLPGFNLAAPPGRSRHNSGNAADCGVIVNGKYISIGNYGPSRASLFKRGLHLPVAGEAWHVEAR